jgi:hypothetical protein
MQRWQGVVGCSFVLHGQWFVPGDKTGVAWQHSTMFSCVTASDRHSVPMPVLVMTAQLGMPAGQCARRVYICSNRGNQRCQSVSWSSELQLTRQLTLISKVALEF